MSAETVRNVVALARAVTKKAEAPPADPLTALSRWIVTDEQVQEMKSTRMIWRDMIAASHLSVWSAPGNGGKTTIARLAAGELASMYTVLFFQEDASAGDLPALHQHAKDHGYHMLNSTLADSCPEEQIDVLHDLVRGGAPLDRFVMFFDTLKKFTDLMSKGGAREFFKLMRALTQRGATVVLLGHTNKHRSVDGKVIFEGVGDVRNDVDELIYIEATDKDASGLVTLTMRPDKVRCAVRETTFQLDTKTMKVSALNQVVDVAAMLEAKRRYEEDKPVIELVRQLLKDAGLNYTVLVERLAHAAGKSRNAVSRVVDRYLSQDPTEPAALWIETRLSLKNARHIALKPRPEQ
jgi:hypothetical protein